MTLAAVAKYLRQRSCRAVVRGNKRSYQNTVDFFCQVGYNGYTKTEENRF